MKKYTFNMLGFILGLFILNLIFIIILKDSIYTREYEAVKLGYKTYLLSDSHGLPLEDSLENVGIFNFAAGSDSYYDIYRKVSFLIKNTDVERIIISVEDHTLSEQRANSNNLDRSLYYADQEDFNSIYEFVKKKYIINNLPLLSSKSRIFIKYYLQHKLSPPQKSYILKDWSKLPLHKKKEMCTNRYNVQFQNRKKSNSLVSSLKDIINICKVNNIEIIGIKFPLSRDYIATIGNKNFGADSLFYENNIKVLDLKDLYLRNDNYFSDEDHLNIIGGKIFSEFLVNLLK